MTYQNLLITTQQAEDFAKKYYGIIATAKSLPGFEDFNFRLKTNDNKTYILKISRGNTNLNILDFQTSILEHFTNKSLSVKSPKPVKSLTGQTYFSFQDKNDLTRWMRMNTWVDGKMCFDIKFHSDKLLQSWGTAAGEIVKSLQDFNHKAAHISHDWDLSKALDNRTFRQYIKDKNQLKIADYFWDLFENQVLPLHTTLRKSIIHSDINDYNTIVHSTTLTDKKITGVIDCGDALYTHTINELAIAAAYATMFKPNPLEAVKNLVKGFHKVFPLQDDELKVLFPLIANRLLTSASHAAKNHVFEPDNEYLFISEKPAWDALELWYKIPPNLAYYTFRDACGLVPCPKRVIFDEWFSDLAFAKIVDCDNEKVIELDLSVSSLDLGNNSNFATARQMQKRIDDILWENEATIGIGGYGEIRPFYNSEAYISASNNGRQWRTCHLGLDIWAKVETPVFAAFDGTVYSIQDNKGDDNYGPTIILEHKINAELTFYTLYGHLSPIDKNLKVGQVIKKGQQIATIGTFPQNGNWAEHLHFQVILDMLGQVGDFFGVCTPSEKDVWLSICPNVNLPLTATLATELEVKTAAKAVTTVENISQKRNQFLGKNLSLSYQKPLHIVRAYKQFLYDENGRRYLDTVNNVPHVGHQHPKVVNAAKRQIEVLNTNTRYLHQNIVEYAEQLLSTFPPELCVVYFVNSGSEANELALRMAKTATNQQDMIAVEVGYHGNTNETIAVSSYKFDSKGGNGKPKNTHIVPMPDTYRGQYKNPETAGEQYAQFVHNAIQQLHANGRNIAGFICESILSCGGQVVLPKGYLKNTYEYIRKAGGICIADEVQVGFGRVGEKFWGFELQEVVPDIVTMGKPIGNGHPLAAVVTTRKVADAFDNGMEYFNTFGGNPVSCAIGKAVLEVIQTEHLQQNALEVGNYLKAKLIDLQSTFSIIGEVRGYGLFLGIELVRDSETLEAADIEASFIANRMRENAILMSTDGPLYNVLKIKPPMCFTKSDADFLVETLEKVLGELM